MSSAYIFAYGSLVNTESRNHTGGSELVGPVRIRGFQRSWNMCASKMTVLGCAPKPEASCNGVIISIPEEKLPEFDEREHLYKRVNIPSRDIDFLDGTREDIKNIWIYISPDPKSPSTKHPIARTYVDVVLTGFLEHGKEFAREFVDTTEGWNWIKDDRDEPIYVRAMKVVNKKSEIDDLVSEFVK